MTTIALFLIVVCALVVALWVIDPIDYAKRRKERGYWGT
jgi:hypothetical protein